MHVCSKRFSKCSVIVENKPQLFSTFCLRFYAVVLTKLLHFVLEGLLLATINTRNG